MGNGFVKNIKYLADCALEVIYWGDGRCITCGNEAFHENALCGSCWAKIKRCTDPLRLSHNGLELECYSSAYYSKVVRELVLGLKYKSDYKSAGVLAMLMEDVMVRNSLEADFLTFVPISRITEKKRGYNQSEIIARLIRDRTGMRIKDTLSKEAATKDQIGLGKRERWENIEGTFKLKKGIKVFGEKFILVDDVVTTGATAFWCAETLIKNGADRVLVLTAAKSGV
jgi:competence protein ComFC